MLLSRATYNRYICHKEKKKKNTKYHHRLSKNEKIETIFKSSSKHRTGQHIYVHLCCMYSMYVEPWGYTCCSRTLWSSRHFRSFLCFPHWWYVVLCLLGVPAVKLESRKKKNPVQSNLCLSPPRLNREQCNKWFSVIYTSTPRVWRKHECKRSFTRLRVQCVSVVCVCVGGGGLLHEFLWAQ